jgi:hypothetical protein
MAEHQGSERTCNERDGEGQQAGQQRDGRIGGVSEEHLREIVRSGGAVCVEVVELDGGADHGSGDHGFHRIAHHCLRFTSGCFDCTHWITPVTSVMRCRLPTCADNVFLLFSCVQSSFRCLTPCGRQQKDPAACRAINVCVLRASNPASVGEGLKLHCSNQSANESGIIIRADSSTRATIPFIVANLLSQSLVFGGLSARTKP